MNTFNSLEEATAAGAKSNDRIRFACGKCLLRLRGCRILHPHRRHWAGGSSPASTTSRVAHVKGWAVKSAKLAEQEAAGFFKRPANAQLVK